MSTPNFENRTLYHGENLDFLRRMNSETVHLIAMDSPFNKNKDFHATPDSLARGARFQDDWSWRDDIHNEWLLYIQLVAEARVAEVEAEIRRLRRESSPVDGWMYDYPDNQLLYRHAMWGGVFAVTRICAKMLF